MEERTKKLIADIFHNAIVIGLAGSLVWGTLFVVKTLTTRNLTSKPQDKPIVHVPDKSQEIPSNDGTGGQEEPKIADLINTTYISRNVYDPKIYNADSINIALKGEFEDAVLYIETNITNDLLNFLYLGFGTINGTWGVERIDNGSIQYDLGSEFTKNDSIKNIDLMTDIKLSNTIKDIDKKLGGFKLKTPWDYTQPQTSKNNGSVVNMVASLYDENGNWGSEITKMQILYHCKDSNPGCKVDICPKNTTGSACLDTLFGKGSGDNYGKFYLKFNQ